MELPSWGDFYKVYKTDPQKCRTYAFELGKSAGLQLIARLKLEGNDLDTLAVVVNALMSELKTETTARVEGNKVVWYNRSFCPVMIAARSFNQPWLWLDENAAWPMLQGLGSAVNPAVKHYVPSARAKGDLVCQHVWKLTEKD
jgi:hypothetical protein